jgi:DNA polymerase-4
LRSFEDLEPILWRLSERVSRRLKAAGLAGQSVTLKLKDKDFRLLTRTRSGLAPTQLAARLFDPARQLLRTACDGTAFRLIGIGAADLCDAADADKGDLADQSVVRQAHMEAAIDKLRNKFGANAVQKGIVLRKP